MRASELVALINHEIEQVGDCEMHLVTWTGLPGKKHAAIWFVESVTTDRYEENGPTYIEIESDHEEVD